MSTLPIVIGNIVVDSKGILGMVKDEVTITGTKNQENTCLYYVIFEDGNNAWCDKHMIRNALTTDKGIGVFRDKT